MWQGLQSDLHYDYPVSPVIFDGMSLRAASEWHTISSKCSNMDLDDMDLDDKQRLIPYLLQSDLLTFIHEIAKEDPSSKIFSTYQTILTGLYAIRHQSTPPLKFGELNYLKPSVYSSVYEYASSFIETAALSPLVNQFVDTAKDWIPTNLSNKVHSYFSSTHAFDFDSTQPESGPAPSNFSLAMIILDPKFSILSDAYPQEIVDSKIEALVTLSSEYTHSSQDSLLKIHPTLFEKILQRALCSTISQTKWSEITPKHQKILAQAYLALCQKDHYRECNREVLSRIFPLFPEEMQHPIQYVQNMLNPEKSISSCLNPKDSQWRRSLQYLRIAMIRWGRKHPQGSPVYRGIKGALEILHRVLAVALHFIALTCYRVAALVFGAYNTSTFVNKKTQPPEGQSLFSAIMDNQNLTHERSRSNSLDDYEQGRNNGSERKISI